LAFIIVSSYVDPILLYEAVYRGVDTDNLFSGHIALLFGDMLYFPSTVLGLIFGEGRYVFGNPNDVQSDVGYVNDILFGGLIYFGFYFRSLYKLFYFRIKEADFTYRLLISASFVML